MAVTALQAFTNDVFETIRTVDSDGKIYFSVQNFATALGYNAPHQGHQCSTDVG